MANLKENGTLVIGEGHGGGFSQVDKKFSNEIAEIILSDRYHTPSWNAERSVFPNTRYSRNIFLNIISSFKNIFTRSSKRMLVPLYTINYFGVEPVQNNSLVKNGMVAEFIKSRIAELHKHFNSPIDFKLHPRQYEGVDELKYFIKSCYPTSKIITGGNLRDLSHRYAGLIFFDYWATAIIELSSSRKKMFVYLGPELSISDDYKDFLLKTSKYMTNGSIDSGMFVEINNRKYKSTYGSSFFYPIHFARLIKASMHIFLKNTHALGGG